MLFSIPENSVIIFTHCPRTGGTTLTRHLAESFQPNQCLIDGTPEFEDFLDLRLRSQQLARYKLVAGHVLYGVHEKFVDPTVYLGLVRHPLERFHSVVRFINSDPDHYLHPEIFGMTPDDALEKLLQLEEFRLIRGQCEFLCQLDDFELAKRNALARYLLVGPTERLREYSEMLALCGIGKEPISTILNSTVAGDEVLSAPAQARVMELAKEDLKLYGWVQAEFDRIAARVLR